MQSLSYGLSGFHFHDSLLWASYDLHFFLPCAVIILGITLFFVGFNVNNIKVATFYHLARLENYEDMKPPIHDVCTANNVKGTILLAQEGINSTIAGSNDALNNVFAFLKSDKRLKDLCWRQSTCDFMPFQMLKVRLKKEIVRMADCDLEVMQDTPKGQYIDPENWADFISKPDVATIDIRNSYETKIGSFKKAIDPKTTNFRDFTDWVQNWIAQNNIKKDQKIAMYCTGGIRCEKSTAYMKKLGFDNVYHLKGGIIAYFAKTQNKSSAWQGHCFVFDDRVAVDQNLNPVKLYCIKCNKQVTTDDLKDVTKGRVICSDCNLK